MATINYMLPPGHQLLVTAGAGTVWVLRLPDVPGGASAGERAESVAAGGSLTLGPFPGQRQYQISGPATLTLSRDATGYPQMLRMPTAGQHVDIPAGASRVFPSPLVVDGTLINNGTAAVYAS